MPRFSEFTFPSTTGENTIYAKMCEPDTKPRGIFQIAHGITEHIEFYEEFMQFLAEHGFVAVGNDHLGHGKTVTSPADKGFFSETNGWEHAVDDLAALHDITAEKFPGLPYLFFGHSMGSFLTRTFLIRYPDKADAAVLSGTGMQNGPKSRIGFRILNTIVKTKGARYVSKTVSGLIFGSYGNKCPEKRTHVDWICRDTNVVDMYVNDPMAGFVCTASLYRDMVGGILFNSDQENMAKMNKDTPVLFISGYNDPVGDYGKGVIKSFEAFRYAGMKHVHIKLYPGARHDIIFELNKNEVLDDIMNWTEDKLAKM